jgi:hypothetical protein
VFDFDDRHGIPFAEENCAKVNGVHYKK